MLRYHDIQHDTMLQGEGLRVAIFFSGCEFRCKGCHNSIAWDRNSGIPFDTDAWCEIEDELDKDYIQGLSVLGGEPLTDYNRAEVTQLCKHAKAIFPKKDIWLYTGFLYEQVKDLEIMQYLDVLCEGPFIESLKDENVHWVGSTNQRVIDVKETLKKGEIVLWETL